MNFDLIVVLYTFSGMLANIFYIPQIILYLKNANSRNTISLITWGGWMFCGVIAFCYALLEVQKIEMILVTGINATAQIFIFSLGLFHRLRSPNEISLQKRSFHHSSTSFETENLSDLNSLKLLIISITGFSRSCRRYKRRFLLRK